MSIGNKSPEESYGDAVLEKMRKLVDETNGDKEVTGMLLFLRVGADGVGPLTANVAIVGANITKDAQIMAMACIELNTMMRKLAAKHRVPLEAFSAGVAALVENIRAGGPRAFEKQIIIELKPDREGRPGGRIPRDPFNPL